MATEGTAPGATSMRPRPILLILLVVLAAVALLMRLGGWTGPLPRPADTPSVTPRGPEGATIEPAALDVRLEELASERPVPGDTERNPFRFSPKAAPPAPEGQKPSLREEAGPVGPAPPPPPPPITVKFIGTLELSEGAVVAIFTDCTVGRRSVPVREGGTILGQYRLVKIGLQSVVVEHIDGRGRTTLPKTGQECVK